MAVVGIDFGLDTCYISVARQGGIETIANDYSMRENPSFVGFGEKQRFMAVSAKNQLLTNLKRTFFGFKSMLGRKFDDPYVQEEASRLPYPITKGPDGGIRVHVEFQGEMQAYSPEQLTAMLFTKLKATAETALQTKVKDVVISVPLYYTDAERRALLDAASIAGFNVLKLMNDTTATALAYGIYKQDLPAPEEKPRQVIFVDCGHRGIQVAACEFNKGKLVMKACAFDQSVGGRRLTEIVADNINEQFKTTFKVDAKTNKKAMLKLLNETEKLKKQMSANTNKLPINIECFMEDKDVRGHIERSTFEELMQPELERVEATLRSCLAASQWKADDIYAAEVVGGSTRIPAIKALIEKVFGKTPNTTLNADEAVSRGCALQCAILSPTFRVREFSVTDLQPYPIKLRWQAESDAGDMVVFPQYHPVPFSKLLTFYRRDIFDVHAEYGGDAPIPDQHIGTFEVGEVRPTEDGSNQKVKVKVRVNLNGIFTVASASLIEKQEIEEEVPMDVDKEEKKETPASADQSAKPETGATQEEAKQPENAGAAPMDVDPAPAVDQAAAPEALPKMEKRKKTIQKTVDLPVTSLVRGALSRDKLELAVGLEKSLVTADEQETERLNAKNAVEEYVYDIRSKIFDDLADFITEDDRSKLSMELEDAENWLYEDGEKCEKAVYSAKLQEIQARGEPVKRRKIEFDGRARAVEALAKALIQAEKVVEAHKAGDEKYDHLDEAEMDKVYKQIVEKRQWMDNACTQLSAAPKTSNPPVVLTQFYSERQGFDAIVNPIINRSKPKPPPPAKEDEKKKEEEAKAKDPADKPAEGETANKAAPDEPMDSSKDQEAGAAQQHPANGI